MAQMEDHSSWNIYIIFLTGQLLLSIIYSQIIYNANRPYYTYNQEIS